MKVSTDSGTFVIRPYMPSDESAVLDAWAQAFQQTLSPELWEWKYHAAPHGYSIMLCVHEGGDVAAMYGGVIYPVLWAGKLRNFCQLMDNLSNPSYRGALGGRNGIFIRTAREFFREYRRVTSSVWVYGLPGRRHFLLGERLLGYEPIVGGMKRLITDTGELIDLRPTANVGYTSPLADDGPDRLAHLSDRQSRSGRLLARRDGRFFRWRFGQHPTKSYRAWTFRSVLRRRWLGYAVAGIHQDEAVLVDLLLPPRRRQSAAFLSAIAADLDQAGMETVSTWLPTGAKEVDLLASLGFVETEEPLGIVPAVRPIDEELDWARLRAALYYTMADSDLF